MSPAVVQPWLALRRFRDSRDARKYSLAGTCVLRRIEYIVEDTSWPIGADSLFVFNVAVSCPLRDWVKFSHRKKDQSNIC